MTALVANYVFSPLSGFWSDSFSSKLCIFTVVGILVISRSLFADSGVLTGGGGTRKAGLPRGIETVYVRDYEVTK